MSSDVFEKMWELDQKHWWFRGRSRLLSRLRHRLHLQNALILDAGCGTGYARRVLRECGSMIGLDASIESFDCRREPTGMDCVARIESAPFRPNTFDLVLALDVLEHIPDDRAALREMYRVCKPGGHLFIIAPSYHWLWSAHDRALGHQRRYSARELARLVSGSGFEMIRLSHLVATMFLPAAVVRLIRRRDRRPDARSDLLPVFGPLNALLSGLMCVESWLLWRTALPFGLSIVVLARKPARSQGEAEADE